MDPNNHYFATLYGPMSVLTPSEMCLSYFTKLFIGPLTGSPIPSTMFAFLDVIMLNAWDEEIIATDLIRAPDHVNEWVLRQATFPSGNYDFKFQFGTAITPTIFSEMEENVAFFLTNITLDNGPCTIADNGRIIFGELVPGSSGLSLFQCSSFINYRT